MATDLDKFKDRLLNGPALVPPSGMTSNFVDPPNLDRLTIGVFTLCMILATLTVILRMWTKLFIIRQTALEDYSILLGWLLSVMLCVSCGICTKYGSGVHQWDLQLKNFFKMLYWVHITNIIYGPTLFFIKLTILLQYRRVFVPQRKMNMGMFLSIYAAIIILFAFYLIITGFNIFICHPREKFWNAFVEGTCYDINATMKATALFNVISDIFILVLPIPSIVRLQVVARKKIGICLVLASGVLACVLSIIRTFYLFQLVGSADRSYRITIHYLWTSGEIAAGIIISCLPILPRLVRTYAPRIHSVVWGGVRVHEMTPVLSSGMREKKRPSELNNWHELQTEISDNDRSLDQSGAKQDEGDRERDRERERERERELERERGLKDDSSQASLVRASPSHEDPHGEHSPGQGQILMTTHIETRTELHTIAVHRALRADLERQQRQQLRW